MLLPKATKHSLHNDPGVTYLGKWYHCLWTHFKIFAANLSSGLTLRVHCGGGKNWLVIFKFLKKHKLVSFSHHQSDPGFNPVTMNDSTLKEALCFEHLLGLKFIPDLKLNSYIYCQRYWEKIVGWFYCPRKHLAPSAMFYLYNIETRPNSKILLTWQ